MLYKALEKPNAELQETAFECMKTFITGHPIDKEIFSPMIRPLLLTLGDEKVVTLNGVKMLSYLTQLFPNGFNEELLCAQLYIILESLLGKLTAAYKAAQGKKRRQWLILLLNQQLAESGVGRTTKFEMEQKVATIINIFHQTPAASSQYVLKLTQLIIRSEQAMSIGKLCFVFSDNAI